jgi:CheY-like chemotaxis protein
MAHILVVEDDELLREMLVESLSHIGHKVIGCLNGLEAKEILSNQGFDLILSDVQMPVMNGIELLQWTRTKSQTPFVLMSGFSRLLELMRPADIGAQGFITKPFQPDDLTKLIDQILADQSTLQSSMAK